MTTETMNAYEVVSEDLERFPRRLGVEIYRIAELVVARNYSQARWLAWKTDDGLGSFCGRPLEMPRFSVHIFRHDVGGEPRIVTNAPEFQDGWGAGYDN